MYKKENLWMIIWRVLYPIAIFIGVELLVEVDAYFRAMAEIAQKTPELMENSEKLAETISRMILNRSLYITAVRSTALIPIYVMFMLLDRKKDRALNRYVTYSKISWTWYLLLPIVGFTAAIGFNQFITITHLEDISPAYQKASQIIYSGNLTITILTSVILAPVVEELLFRGLVYKRLRNHLQPVWCALISSIAFGIIHGNIVQFTYAFLVGMIICWVYEKFKSIWSVIIFHAGANLISAVLTELVPEFGGTLPTGVFLLLTVCWLAATFMLLWLFHTKMKRVPVNKVPQENGANE